MVAATSDDHSLRWGENGLRHRRCEADGAIIKDGCRRHEAAAPVLAGRGAGTHVPCQSHVAVAGDGKANGRGGADAVGVHVQRSAARCPRPRSRHGCAPAG